MNHARNFKVRTVFLEELSCVVHMVFLRRVTVQNLQYRYVRFNFSMPSRDFASRLIEPGLKWTKLSLKIRIRPAGGEPYVREIGTKPREYNRHASQIFATLGVIVSTKLSPELD